MSARNCAKCDHKYTLIRYLDCGHGFCTKCLQEVHNSSALKTGDRTVISCSSCSHTTNIKEGLDSLPRTPPLKPPEPPRRIGPAVPGTKLKDARKVWHRADVTLVWDVDFLMDSILCIVSMMSGGKYSRVLKRFSLFDGDTLDAEEMFPLAGITHPSGISYNQSINSLAISEWSHSKGGVNVLKSNQENHWECTHFDLPDMAQRLTLTSSYDVICTLRNDSLYKMNSKGKQVWRVSLPDGDSNPFLDNDNEGNVVISTPNSKEVFIYDNMGNASKPFPRQFINQPGGVCFDSAGRVFVSIQDGSIWAFTKEGRAIKKVVDKAEPGCIRCYERYLILGARQGLTLYELDWN